MTSYYDIAAANDRVGELRPLLEGLRDDRDAIAAAQLRLRAMQGDDGDRARLEREQERMTTIVRRMEITVRQIDAWGVVLRDIGSGTVDFPALVEGRPMWLCWKLDEEGVSFQHRQDEACGLRRRLSELEDD